MDLKRIFPDFDELLIEQLLRVGEIVFIPSGELLLRPGQYFKSTMLILKGSVKLYSETAGGREFFLYFLEPGSACALSIICSIRKTSDVKARAISDVSVLLIPFEHMDNLLKNYPRWSYFLLDNYHSRFQEMLRIVDQIAFESMDKKLETYLKMHFEVMKSSTITTTHQDIARDLNSSREVISRLLKKLEADNRIAISRNEITNIGL